MKKNNENKNQKKDTHNVETPTPPQVMDPSAAPVNPSEPVKKKKDKKKSPREKSREENESAPDQEKLAPREEL